LREISTVFLLPLSSSPVLFPARPFKVQNHSPRLFAGGGDFLLQITLQGEEAL
jgi:hypothetical protein